MREILTIVAWIAIAGYALAVWYAAARPSPREPLEESVLRQLRARMAPRR